MKKMRKLLLPALLACVAVMAALAFTACSGQKTENSSYKIAAVYDAENQRVDALITVSYVNQTGIELSGVRFHLYPRAYRQGAKFSPVTAADQASAYQNGMSYGDLTVLSVKRDSLEKQIKLTGQDEDILEVEGNLEPYSKTTVEIDFRLELPNVRHRLGHFNDIVNLGNWFPILCVHKDGDYCDTPYYSNGDPFFSETADFDVSITTNSNFAVATSGKQTVSLAGETKTTHAVIKNARDFAAVIGEFNVEKRTHSGIEINYYYMSDSEPAKAVQTAVDSLNTFSDMMGDYVYDSLSIVKTPFLHGGMEYPALIYISDIATGDNFTEVIVHETAHQWWYAAVGSDQVNEAWLDEGLTEYTTTLFYEKNPSYNVTAEERLANSLATYLLYIEAFKNNGRGDTSMNRCVADFATSVEYNVMTYVKGELMMDALRNTVGDKSFFKGLKAYYKAYKLKTATGELFMATMEANSKTDLTGFFDSWLNGKVKMYAN